MAAGVCLLLMTILLVSYIDSVRLINDKAEINQIARKYILRMETEGVLTEMDRLALNKELAEVGVSDISLEGTTMVRVGYGEAITLHIRGKLGGTYVFEEKRVSTAKY